MIQSIDYWAIAAPLILALTSGLVLVLDVFLPNRAGASRTVLGLVSLVGVLAALGVVVAQAVRGDELRTFCVPGDAASCSFVMDSFTEIFAGLTLVAGAVVVLLSMAELAGGRIPVGEWYFLLLATLTGAVLLPAARDLVMLVVALELVSLPVFALTALRRYDGRASEASLKLFVVSVVSTAVMLFGVSLLYGMTGAVHLDRLAAALRPTYSSSSTSYGGSAMLVQQAESTGAVLHNGSAVVTVGVVLVVAGFAFKVAAVPFHFWAGDVYEGAPVPVAALLSVISKAAGFAGLILVLSRALFSEAATWTPLVAIIAALTMTVGNVLALRQRHAVRMLAWSSVAQSGYILAPLAVHMDVVALMNAMIGPAAVSSPEAAPAETGSAASVISKSQAIELSGDFGMPWAVNASIAYLVFYAAMNLLAFAVVMLISRRHARNQLDDYRGLAYRSPRAAISLAFALICLAGLPPGLAGLFAKVVVFREIVAGGLGWLAIVMAVNTVIGLYYYLAWTARLFTPAPAGESRTVTEERGRTPVIIAIGAALLLTVAFSVVPQLVLGTLA
ncbi:NADH-quinone oxidoreductase subunit N [Acrocarpospora macrocephala]|uniref:NADH-quinone oxidoreductase subunit N n=1 Tax=Acrocarpospora macrocephala TaxID=150177 RepID=A0A5M3WG42_9ACTN|nr:NADH-quinone oxidoreductase subunit N [Acrocarpospora macrocephala]GES08067.1 NADH-quinone oxidoreductase subunit N [Acrocarpospora macrocephala]